MHALRLMDRDDNHSPFTRLADEKAIQRFMKKVGPGPTITDFRVDLKGSRTSTWNRRAARVFRIDFLSTKWYSSLDAAAIEATFLTHLKALQLQYNKLLRPDDDSEQVVDEQRLASRRQRRHGVGTLYLAFFV